MVKCKHLHIPHVFFFFFNREGSRITAPGVKRSRFERKGESIEIFSVCKMKTKLRVTGT